MVRALSSSGQLIPLHQVWALTNATSSDNSHPPPRAPIQVLFYHLLDVPQLITTPEMSLFPVTHTYPAPSSPTQEGQPQEDRDGFHWLHLGPLYPGQCLVQRNS